MAKAILSLHGFPGPAGIYEEGIVDFIDELKKIALERNCEILHPSYPGIIDDDDFNFLIALEYTEKLIPQILEDYDEVTIIARSFGGMALLYALRNLKDYKSKIKNLIFVTPLLQLPPLKSAELIISDTHIQAPGLLDQSKTAEYLLQIQTINNIFRPFEQFNKGSFEVTPVFVGAELDETTPAIYISKFAQLTGGQYVSISGAHDLGNKSEIIQVISAILD